MLTFLLIGGLVWLFVALVFVLALAAAARPQSFPAPAAEPLVMEPQNTESIGENVLPCGDGLLPEESPVPT